jgi:CYTH domain-containing protein
VKTEIERKFLLKHNKIDVWKQLKENWLPSAIIIQGYLCSDNEKEIRVRYSENDFIISSAITIKRKLDNDGLSRSEFETPIKHSDALELLHLCPTTIKKQRWKYEYSGHVFEIDEYLDDALLGLVVIEVELDTVSEMILLPEFIGDEITGLKEYSNQQLAKKGMC